MDVSLILFYVFGAIAVGATLLVVVQSNPVYSVLLLIGSFIGAITGAIVGIPIPAVGSILAAILFGGTGAMIGAMYGEWSDGRPWRESWAVGHAAFWGRTFGMLGKLAAGVAIVLLVVFSLLV